MKQGKTSRTSRQAEMKCGGRLFLIVPCSAYSSNLIMEAECSSKNVGISPKL
jgi:hypothetical protein